jgi:hypothetical protein
MSTQNALNKNFFIELLEYSDTPIVYAKTSLTALPTKYTIGKNQTLTATSTPVNYIVK